MSKVAVIYWSGTGNTEAMANAVAEGAKAAGASVDLMTCAEVTGVDGYDAVALGCPAMGMEELEDGEFQPMLESIEPSLPGRKVVLFGSYDWGVANGSLTGKHDAQKRESIWLQRALSATMHLTAMAWQPAER